MQLDTIEPLTQFAFPFYSDSETIIPQISDLPSSTEPVIQKQTAGEPTSMVWANLEDIVLQMKTEGAVTFHSTPKLLAGIREARDRGPGTPGQPGEELHPIGTKAAVTGDLLWGKFLMALNPLLPRQLSKKAAHLLQTRMGSLAHFETEV